jgi:hypothetical protein
MNNLRKGVEYSCKDDKVTTLCIKTAQGDWTTDFSKTTKIGEVIQAIVGHFGFAANGKYELRLEKNPQEPLDIHRPLVSYQIEDGDCVVFTDLGLGM